MYHICDGYCDTLGVVEAIHRKAEHLRRPTVIHVRLRESEALKLDNLKAFAGETRSDVLRRLLREAKLEPTLNLTQDTSSL